MDRQSIVRALTQAGVDTRGMDIPASPASVSQIPTTPGTYRVGNQLYVVGDDGVASALVSSTASIKSPLDIAAIKYWLSAKYGCLKSDYTACTTIADTVTFWQDGVGTIGTPTVTGTPKYDTTGINGYPAVKFNGSTDLFTTPVFIDNTYLTGSYATMDISVFLVMKIDPATANRVPFSCAPASGNFYIEANGSTTQIDITAGAITGHTGFPTSFTEGVFGFSIKGGVLRQYLNGIVVDSSLSSTPIDQAVTLAGTPPGAPVSAVAGIIGDLVGGGFKLNGWIGEVVIGKGLTKSEFKSMCDYLCGDYGYTTPIVVLSSNSQASGSGTSGGAAQSQMTGTTNLRAALQTQLGVKASVRLDAYVGRAMVQVVSESANTTDQMAGFYNRKDIALLWEATNTITTLLNLNAAKTLTVKYCTDRKAAGFKYVGVATPLKRLDVGANNALVETMRQQYNAWLRNNFKTFADFIVDFDSYPALDIAVTPTNFNADNVHINDAGTIVVSTAIKAALTGYL